MLGSPLHTIEITDADDPRVGDYAHLREAHRREQGRSADAASAAAGTFIAEGDLVIGQLVRSRFKTRSVLIARHRVEGMAAQLGRLGAGTPIYTVDQALMNGLVGFDIHRGVLACGERGEGLRAEDVASGSRVLVVLEDLANHDNIGSIFRSVAALGGLMGGAGVPGVLLSPRCADPLYRKAVRVSMGHILRVPFAVVREWPAGLGRLREAGFLVIGLTPDERAVDIREIAKRSYLRPPRIALVVGAEGPGLSPEAKGMMTELAKIPMAEGVDSLNVSVAAAVALHRLADVG